METLGSTDQAPPRLSVIVPVRDGAGFLAQSLPALRASDLARDAWELIVVDDASRDGSGEVAARFADLVVRPSGADVSVHEDALRRLARAFDDDAVAAVFGAYDTSPRAPGLVSQYRNLLHHWVHVQGRGEAETFWAGLGAVRRRAFLAAGEFDETMSQLEDIDLGYRLRALGHRILLRPEIQGTHLKQWTLGSMVRTDLFGRGVTWMRLHLEQGRKGRPGTLNLRPAEKLYTLLAFTAALALGVALVGGDGRRLIGAGR